MAALLEAYITNLGKYAEGQLVDETLKFPTTAEEVQSLLKRIGVDGIRYEEIFITSFDGDVLGLHEHLGEYESIDELNYLAALLSEMDQSDIEKFEAVIDAGEYTGSVKDLCFPCTREFHQQFHQAVLDAYQQAFSQFPQRQQERPEQPSPSMDGMTM